MRLNSWRGTTTVPPKPRRRFPWVRLLIVVIIVAAAAYVIVPNLSAVRADALVQGDLVPVTPVYRARLEKLLVGCNSSVVAGQPVAIVSNFLIQADYQRDYLQAVEQSELASDALEQNVATATANAESLHEKYVAALVENRRLAGEYASYERAYEAGAVSQVTRDAKRLELKSSEAVAKAALQAWDTAQLRVKQITAAQQSRVAASGDLLAQSKQLEERLGSEALKAPVGGDVVDCFDRPQIVIEAGTPIFNIFSHDKAYVVAYFDPSAISKIHIGQKADLKITGLSHDVTGRIAWIYPNLDALPDQLTRFFWQKVQFSEFRPVKIVLDDLPESERARLYYNAQTRVTVALTGQNGR